MGEELCDYEREERETDILTKLKLVFSIPLFSVFEVAERLKDFFQKRRRG
jgi:hypothetical protein